MSLDKEKEKMIHDLLELKRVRNKEIDETVNLIDKADTQQELMEALVKSPLGQVATRRNKQSIVKLQELHDSILKFSKDINHVYDNIKIKETEIKQETPKPRKIYKDNNLQYAYEMGFDSAINGSNKTNCHVALFLKESSKTAWELGQKEGFEIDKLKSRV